MQRTGKYMRIAQISPMCFDTPPKDGGYGGTEWVVGLLTAHLVEQGHDVVLFATGTSKTPANLQYWFEEPIAQGFHINHEILHVTKAYEYIRSHDFDIVHNHTYSMGPALLSLVDCPSLTTVHLTTEQVGEFYSALPSHRFAAISERQRQIAPEVNWAGMVYNGIRVADFASAAPKEDYLLFLSTLVPWKGPQVAIRIAKRLGRRLKIAGPIYDQAWFDQEIAPHIDGEMIEYHGPVNFQQKVALYTGAAAFLFPIDWEEPFGLVMIESLACGTPVIAFACGAAPEVIPTGEVGWIVKNEDEMAAAVEQVESIAPETCRAHVATHFSSQLMTQRYIRLYEEIMRQAGRA